MRSMRHTLCLQETDPEARTRADNMYMQAQINVTNTKQIYEEFCDFYSTIGLRLREIEHKLSTY
jgi:hypothetical protein